MIHQVGLQQSARNQTTVARHEANAVIITAIKTNINATPPTCNPSMHDVMHACAPHVSCKSHTYSSEIRPRARAQPVNSDISRWRVHHGRPQVVYSGCPAPELENATVRACSVTKECTNRRAVHLSGAAVQSSANQLHHSAQQHTSGDAPARRHNIVRVRHELHFRHAHEPTRLLVVLQHKRSEVDDGTARHVAAVS